MEDDRETRARGKRPPQGEPVIDRALTLLSAFDASRRRLSLAELSRRSGIPVSSTLRLAGHLVRWGALERDEDGRYRPIRLGHIQVQFERPETEHLAVPDIRHPPDRPRHAAESCPASL